MVVSRVAEIRDGRTRKQESPGLAFIEQLRMFTCLFLYFYVWMPIFLTSCSEERKGCYVCVCPLTECDVLGVSWR